MKSLLCTLLIMLVGCSKPKHADKPSSSTFLRSDNTWATTSAPKLNRTGDGPESTSEQFDTRKCWHQWCDGNGPSGDASPSCAIDVLVGQHKSVTVTIPCMSKADEISVISTFLCTTSSVPMAATVIGPGGSVRNARRKTSARTRLGTRGTNTSGRSLGK